MTWSRGNLRKFVESVTLDAADANFGARRETASWTC